MRAGVRGEGGAGGHLFFLDVAAFNYLDVCVQRREVAVPVAKLGVLWLWRLYDRVAAAPNTLLATRAHRVGRGATHDGGVKFSGRTFRADKAV